MALVPLPVNIALEVLVVFPVPPCATGNVPKLAAPLLEVAYKAPLAVDIVLTALVLFPASIALEVRVVAPVPPLVTGTVGNLSELKVPEVRSLASVVGVTVDV
jgi:hypothetical protein